jgi:CRISPR-associated protein Cas5d
MAEAVSVKVWGEFALFTRPELKVERLSYPLMTPSAARGVLDAILFRPQMRWHVRRITALEPNFPNDFPVQAARQPYRLIGVRRNEIQGKVAPRTVESWMKDPSSMQPYLVDSAGREGAQGQNRTQRNSLVLQHVAYRIDATPMLTDRANRPRVKPEDDEDQGPDTVTKYVAMFQRRVAKGQCFHRPYLGCREFACHFAAPNASERPLTDWTERLGLMLYDIRFGPDGTNQPGFFFAEMKNGVMHCDTRGTGPNGEPPIQVLGWDDKEDHNDPATAI